MFHLTWIASLKVLYLNTVTLRVRASTYDFWGTAIQSITEHFYLLVIVNNTAMKMVWKYFLNSFSFTFKLFYIYPEMKLLDHKVILFSIFWGTAILFTIEAQPFYIPTICAQDSNIPHPHQHCCFVFDISHHPNRYEMMSHYGFHLQLPNKVSIVKSILFNIKWKRIIIDVTI